MGSRIPRSSRRTSKSRPASEATPLRHAFEFSIRRIVVDVVPAKFDEAFLGVHARSVEIRDARNTGIRWDHRLETVMRESRAPATSAHGPWVSNFLFADWRLGCSLARLGTASMEVGGDGVQPRSKSSECFVTPDEDGRDVVGGESGVYRAVGFGPH